MAPPEAYVDGSNNKEEAAAQQQETVDKAAAMLAALEINKAPLPKGPLMVHSPDVATVANLIKQGKAKNIVFMCGAGISVSAGIPDFRTPGTGLYSQLQKYNLSEPEDIFDMDFFKENPEPFHQLARELFPGKYKPTATHYLMRLFHEKGLLLRCFSQNIDSLETQAGLPAQAVVAAHGNFDSAHCIRCKCTYPASYFKAAVDKGDICHCRSCKGLVKPSIVFFGEDLPERFYTRSREDLPRCDLLIIMGTSLVVHPFAGLIFQVGPKVPRIVVNREVIKGASGREFKYNFDMCPEEGRRDGIFLGDCDDFAEQLAGELGWYDDLQKFVKANKRQAAAEEQAAKQKAAKKEQAAKRKAAAGDDTAGLKCCGLF